MNCAAGQPTMWLEGAARKEKNVAETPLIFTLIPKVMADIGAVAKTGRNEQQGYSFRGIDSFYNAAHPALVKHGVFCCPQVLEYTSEDRVMKNGSPAVRVTMKVAHRFYAPDGSFIEVITCGEGLDTSDKASNKSMSAAMKYALIELFSIPTADIDDSDKTSPEAGQAGKGSIAEPVTLTRPAKGPETELGKALIFGHEVAVNVPVPELEFVPEAPVFIDVHQKSYLSRRFRENLKKELEPQANEKRHEALVKLHQSKKFKSALIDINGNPSQEGILLSEYQDIGRELVKIAKSL
jgi:hypothetical protein